MRPILLTATLLVWAPPDDDDPPLQAPTVVNPQPSEPDPAPSEPTVTPPTNVEPKVTPPQPEPPQPEPKPSLEPPQPEPQPQPQAGGDPTQAGGLTPVPAPDPNKPYFETPLPPPRAIPTPDTRPPEPGTGMNIGSSVLLIPSISWLISGVNYAIATGGLDDPGARLNFGLGISGLAASGVLLGLSIWQRNKLRKWSRQYMVRPPNTGNGLLVGGGILFGLGLRRLIEGAVEMSMPDDYNSTLLLPAEFNVALGSIVVAGAGVMVGFGVRSRAKYSRWLRDRDLVIAPAPMKGGATLSLSARF